MSSDDSEYRSLEQRATRIGSSLDVGARIGQYKLDKRLGKGGMGEVWRAIDPTRGDEVNPGYVALKFLPREIQESPRELRRALETFRAVQALQHPNICPVYFLQELPNYGHVLAMKYIDGINLLEFRDAYLNQRGTFPLSMVIKILRPIAAALDYAHHPDKVHSGVKCVIHRDIKPENILIGRDGREIQIVDFGLAAQVRLSMTRVSNVEMDSVGTRSYMAPEQWRGQLQDDKTDQYALAVVAYELIADQLPFEVADPFQLRECVLNEAVPEIAQQPASVNQALSRAMAKQREDRFPNCLALVEALGQPLIVKAVKPNVAPALLHAPFDSNAAKAAQEAWAAYLGQSIQWNNTLGMAFRLIPPGEFLMGNEEPTKELLKAFPYAKKEWLEDAYPRHSVRLTRPWYAGAHLVTLGDFRRFVDTTNYRTEAERDGEGGWGWNDVAKEFEGRKPEYTWRSTGFPQTDRHPVVNVSWKDAQKFIAWLNESGQPETLRYRYRLPSEAEWEYACRAGTTTRYPNGNDPERLPEIGNVWDATAKEVFGTGYANFIQAKDGYAFTSPVGVFAPNPFGLSDTIGNAFEWCQDWYGADYYQQFKNQAAIDPTGAAPGSSRCLRGGAWGYDSVYCRPAYRSYLDPADRKSYIGFRVVCELC